MKKLAACLIFTAMLVYVTACGGESARDAETVKDSVVTENSSVSPATEGNFTESKETRSTGAEENNAEKATEGAAAVPESGESTAADKESASEETDNTTTAHMGDNTMKITAGDTSFTATLADNSSVEALKELLAEGPLTINMNDYAGMEKVGPIGTDLPRNDEQISTGAGDIILYQGNSLVIYYDTNSWNFTRIGKIEGVTGEKLLEVFGDGDVTVTFSLQ